MSYTRGNCLGGGMSRKICLREMSVSSCELVCFIFSASVALPMALYKYVYDYDFLIIIFLVCAPVW